MYNPKKNERNNDNNAPSHDSSQFVISDGILLKYLGNSTVVTVPEGVKRISYSAFIGCREITEIIIPDSVDTIDEYAFVSCFSLRTVYIGFEVPLIPMEAFAGLPNFESLIITDGAVKIRYRNILKDAPAPKRIGNYAFSACPSLNVTDLKKEEPQSDIGAFDGCFSKTSEGGDIDNVIASEPVKEDIVPDETVCAVEVEEDEHPPVETASVETLSERKIEANFENESLVNGFSVVENEIQNDASHEVIPDEPIESLSLSPRPYNALYHIKESITTAPHDRIMISDLLKISPEHLLQVRNMGVKSAEEIIRRITEYLCSYMLAGEKRGINKQYTIAPGYEVIDGVITHVDSGRIVEDVLIDYIGLGERATNSLHRGKVMKLSELICLTPQQLKGIPYLGTKSITEITELVPRYLKANQVTKQYLNDTEEKNVDLSIRVNIPPLSMEYAVLASDYAVVDGVIYHRKTLKIIPDLPLKELNLSVRSLNCLVRYGKTVVSSLVGMPFSDFRSIRNLGQLSANEIQEKLEQYLEKAHNDSERQAISTSTVSSEQILSILHEHEFESVNLELILQALPDATEEDVQAVLTELVESQKIIRDGELHAIHHISFFVSLNDLSQNKLYRLDERDIRIIQQRSSGKTLEEVGQQEGVTRERIRQVEKKVKRILDRFTHWRHVETIVLIQKKNS